MQGKYGAVTAKLYWKKAERVRMAEGNLRFERDPNILIKFSPKCGK